MSLLIVETDDDDVQDRELLNAKIGWRNIHWNLSVWGKNLTDEEYREHVFVVDTFGSNFDTFLTVATGSAVNALTVVDQNDDDAKPRHRRRVAAGG